MRERAQGGEVMKPSRLICKARSALAKVASLLQVGGWKVRPRVWIEREERETNPGYFPKGKKS